MSYEQHKQIARRFFAEQDRRKGPLDDEMCASGYSVSIAGFPPMNFEQHSQFGKMFYAAFPDLKHSITDLIAEDDKLAVRFIIEGTHKGDFMGKKIQTFSTNIRRIRKCC